ncbi:hypothetical protein CCO02nite_12650 [Cellulomonas composti]|uniref:Uncharacterized protein n=1 Tax=Cellulomonas composti TaxID=266130 RepID=A0A511J9D6_9CELL|nr:hypothetical protein CCO02nite_12650 [Cellulomonas composti]
MCVVGLAVGAAVTGGPGWGSGDEQAAGDTATTTSAVTMADTRDARRGLTHPMLGEGTDE